MIRRISVELLASFRKENFPVNRLRLSDEEKTALSENVEISEDGTVFYKGKAVNQCPDGVYKQVCIRFVPNKPVWLKVHRLVLWAFHDRTLMKRALEHKKRGYTRYSHPDDFEPNHIDNNPLNNHFNNLEPVTREENLQASRLLGKRRTNAEALSRPIMIVSYKNANDPRQEQFPVWHEFSSIEETGRQMCIKSNSIHSSATKGCWCKGVQFVLGARPSDEDDDGEIWSKIVPEYKGVRVSSYGRIWQPRGSIKTRGYEKLGTRYRKVMINGKYKYAHVVIYQIWNAKPNENGILVAAPIPDGKMVLHCGAPDYIRRDSRGYERNWPEDLRIGTQGENMIDMHYEKK